MTEKRLFGSFPEALMAMILFLGTGYVKSAPLHDQTRGEDAESAESFGAEESEETQEAVLQSAHNAFEYGQYEETVNLLRPIVERGIEMEGADKVEALRLYSISLYLTGRKKGARLVFRELIALDSTMRLDPRLVPPQVVNAFDRVRREMLQEKVESLEPMKKRYAVLNFLPPAGQFQNREFAKAYSLLGAEILLLGLNLGSLAVLRTPKYRQGGDFVVQDIDGNIIEDNRKLAKAMRAVNYASFGALLGILVYGMIDGYIVMRRQVRTERARRRFLRRQVVFHPEASPRGGGMHLRMDF